MNHAKRNPGIPKRPNPQKNAKVVLGNHRTPHATHIQLPALLLGARLSVTPVPHCPAGAAAEIHY